MEKGKIIFEQSFPKLTLDDYEKLCEDFSEETAPHEWDEPGAFYKNSWKIWSELQYQVELNPVVFLLLRQKKLLWSMKSTQ